MSKQNTFHQITKQVMQENAGKTLAIDTKTGNILLSRSCLEVLQYEMRVKFPNVIYARLTLPTDNRPNKEL